MPDTIKLHTSWKNALHQEFEKPYFVQLKSFLLDEKNKGEVIFPPATLLFAALDLTPLENVKVVILGQDPYHGIGQAHGLCFSVNDGIRFPPSLQNIFKELKSDINFQMPLSGNVTKWAQQGVLLLNATLSVRKDQAGSHQNKGWEQFTDKIIETVSIQNKHVVFILWGKFAQSKIPLINATKHLILTAAHPSPLSAYNGFFGCRHFSKTNVYLKANGIKEIDWQL